LYVPHALALWATPATHRRAFDLAFSLHAGVLSAGTAVLLGRPGRLAGGGGARGGARVPPGRSLAALLADARVPPARALRLGGAALAAQVLGGYLTGSHRGGRVSGHDAQRARYSHATEGGGTNPTHGDVRILRRGLNHVYEPEDRDGQISTT
jgi:hypothetical protein